MGFVRRAIAGIRRRGFLGNADRLVSMAQEALFDWKYGTDTSAAVTADELTDCGHLSAGVQVYEATRLRPFRQVIARLRPPPGSVFVDFGCGKGRVLLAAAQLGFRRVEGVEFARELCAIAERNIAAFRSKIRIKAEFRIVNADAGEYDVPHDADYFYFFNPFGEQVMRRTMGNIMSSLQRNPRPATLIYCNPLWRRCVEETGAFRELGEFVYREFAVYTNRLSK